MHPAAWRLVLAPPTRLHGITGAFYNSLGMFEEAVSAYSQAIAIEPDNVAALTNRGFALLNEGKANQAIEDLDGP